MMSGAVAAARTLGMVHMDGAAADRLQGILDETGLVQRIGVDLDLKIVLVGPPAGQVSIAAGIDPQSS